MKKKNFPYVVLQITNKAMTEEELVCPQENLREKCRSQESRIAELLQRYNDCNVRVNAKTKTAETCEEEMFDYIHALDECVAKTLWKKLK